MMLFQFRISKVTAPGNLSLEWEFSPHCRTHFSTTINWSLHNKFFSKLKTSTLHCWKETSVQVFKTNPTYEFLFMD